MAVQDIASDLLVNKNAELVSAGAGTLSGDGVDNSDGELGLMFVADCTAYTSGNHTLGAEESDDDGATDPYTPVPAEKLIVNGENGNVVAALNASGDVLKKVGVFSNKKFVRPTLESDGGAATVQVTTIQKSEYMPVES